MKSQGAGLSFPRTGFWSVALEKEKCCIFCSGSLPLSLSFGEKFLSLPVIPALAKAPSAPDRVAAFQMRSMLRQLGRRVLAERCRDPPWLGMGPKAPGLSSWAPSLSCIAIGPASSRADGAARKAQDCLVTEHKPGSCLGLCPRAWGSPTFSMGPCLGPYHNLNRTVHHLCTISTQLPPTELISTTLGRGGELNLSLPKRYVQVLTL